MELPIEFRLVKIKNLYQMDVACLSVNIKKAQILIIGVLI